MGQTGADVRHANRRARYLDAALELFLEHGFNGVSMDQLVAAVGGSKATLYRHFASKEALFEAMIDDIASPAMTPDDGDDWARVEVADGLRMLGALTASAALDQRTIALLRLALGEHARFPELARSLFRHGPARTYARLRGFLEAKVAAGELVIDDVQIGAEQFLGGIIGHQQLRVALGMRRPTQREIEDRIDAAVRTFLAAYAPGPEGRSEGDHS